MLIYLLYVKQNLGIEKNVQQTFHLGNIRKDMEKCMNEFEAAHLRELVALHQPISPKCKIIFFAPPPLMLFQSGKLSSFEFLPEFSRTLGDSGFGVNFRLQPH